MDRFPFRRVATRAIRRRSLLIGAATALGAQGLIGCSAFGGGGVARWQARLTDDSIALLGEVHDNAELHRLRTAALRDALARGWRPSVVMEQFDVDRQDDLERARRERPRDVRHLIEQAGGPRSGWSWPDYEPVLTMVLEHDLPLHAGNLGRAAASRIVREGYAAVFSAAEIADLGLDRAPDAAVQRAQEREIDEGHCGALPPALLPAMARAQFARDAVMAQVVRRQIGRGVVLLAGNGHVRRDLGVARWLGSIERGLVVAVGFVERGQEAASEHFDALVIAAPAPRKDPCSGFVRS